MTNWVESSQQNNLNLGLIFELFFFAGSNSAPCSSLRVDSRWGRKQFAERHQSHEWSDEHIPEARPRSASNARSKQTAGHQRNEPNFQGKIPCIWKSLKMLSAILRRSEKRETYDAHFNIFAVIFGNTVYLSVGTDMVVILWPISIWTWKEQRMTTLCNICVSHRCSSRCALLVSLFEKSHSWSKWL